ncbi:MAG: transglycosylase domain-containing protein [Candidatus Nanopelagicales bacterium]
MRSPHRTRRVRLGTALASLVGFTAVACLAGVIVAGMALPIIGPPSLVVRNSIERFEDLPKEFRTPMLPVRTRIYAADGTKIATVYEENRKEISLAKVAPIMRQAVVAIEDSRFYEHNGFDPRGTMRAAVTNLGAGEITQGGSTLTMQYVKNVFVTAARNAEEQSAAKEDTISRKLREIRYAMALEKKLNKNQILERYLNISYYGANAYGVEAAAQRYFSKSAKDLKLVEAATLAGIVQQPSRFDPTRNPKLSQARRDVVLNRMAELGYITIDQARTAKATPIAKYLNPKVLRNGCTTAYAPFFCDYAVRMVKQMKALGATEGKRDAAWQVGGYKIYTTLDMKAQKSATKAVMQAIPPKDSSRKAVAIAMIEPGTGNIRAMAQNRTWGIKGKGKTTYNYVVDYADGGTAGMQAGSTFKIFTLVGALEAGLNPLTVINAPARKTFYGFRGCGGEGFPAYTVKNSTRSGNFDMFRGAAYSVNTFFVELERRAGLCSTVNVAKKMGVTLAKGGELPAYPSFTLGSMEVSPLTLANAYATVSAHGVYCEPRVITKIVDRAGREIPVPGPKCNQAVSRNAADAAAAILTNVVDGGVPGRTGSAMSIGRDTTGKTGTTDSNAAVWFAGSTPDLGAAVWVGDPRGGYRHPLTYLTINGRYYRQVFGSSLPGPTWKKAMMGALAGSRPVAMDLQNQWGLKPARQAGTPAQKTPINPKPKKVADKKPDKKESDKKSDKKESE